jgi:hypothetical protein
LHGGVLSEAWNVHDAFQIREGSPGERQLVGRLNDDGICQPHSERVERTAGTAIRQPLQREV